MTNYEINNWDDIYHHISHHYRKSASKDFIVLKLKGDELILLSENEIDDNKTFKYYLVPYYYINSLAKSIYYNEWGSFNKDPTYHITYFLFKYRKDINTYILLWFNAILTQLVRNESFYGLNQDKIKHFYDITKNELLKRDIDPMDLYGANRTNFCPLYILFDYEQLDNSINKNDSKTIIEYISLLIERIKSNERMIIIYE